MIEGGPDSLEAPSIRLSLDIKEMWGIEVPKLKAVTEHKSGIKLGDGTVSTSHNWAESVLQQTLLKYVSCTVVVLTCFVMCGYVYVWFL